MESTELYAARIAALEQRQRRFSSHLQWLLIAIILLAGLACWQQFHNNSLLTQHESLLQLLQQMETFQEPVGHREPPTDGTREANHSRFRLSKSALSR